MYLDKAEADIKDRQDLSKEEFWRNLVRSEQQDPINEYIMRAGLFEQSFTIHKDYLMRIYTELFYLDPDDQNTIIMIYQKLGSIFGCIIYMIEHRNDMDPAAIAKHMAGIAEDGI